ncbi:hypothetical protein Lal_00034977 [Lupinus albus]|uniref:BCAS3 domain-containing protein n=1 Tax=Lupinus albus TaxID=3870 RepID=A0A6A4QVM9_LUPAL|nr:hypothetical protein Lalb_Chr03g0030161 [Lupinus albus]KAF1897274.1 hypothetical protein Lal_00034977 [Lupinus albus]
MLFASFGPTRVLFQPYALILVAPVQGHNINVFKIMPGCERKLKEKHHLYISEAELQMHQVDTPLWAKAEIYIHSMGKEAIMMMDEKAASGGEIEIERFPTRMIEARPKYLVPIFDYI